MRDSLLGKRFGRLYVVARDHKTVHGKWFYLCVCDCGNFKAIVGRNLLRGETKSCGCLRKEIDLAQSILVDGVPSNKHPLHRMWEHMLQRCKKHKGYTSKGIVVCERWKGVGGFKRFVEDMGPKPEPTRAYSIERIDNDGDYSPENCKWANRYEQNRNKSVNVMVTIDGRTQCVTDWAIEYDIDRNTCFGVKRNSPQMTWEEVFNKLRSN